MSNFEIFLIVAMCLVPVVSLITFLPKKLKGLKKKKPESAKVKTLEDLKKEEQPKEIKAVEKQSNLSASSNEISTDDFKDYLQRRKPTSKPKRMELPPSFLDRTSPYARMNIRNNQKPKSVSEEFKSLSPKLKSLIISGVFDPKDFDKF